MIRFRRELELLRATMRITNITITIIVVICIWCLHISVIQLWLFLTNARASVIPLIAISK